MNVTLSGDAMRACFHRGKDIAALKREKVPDPVAWKIHPDDITEHIACEQHGQGFARRHHITIGPAAE